jgi:hypothetical protein
VKDAVTIGDSNPRIIMQETCEVVFLPLMDHPQPKSSTWIGKASTNTDFHSGSNITESESLLLRAIWPKTFKADVVQELGLDEYFGQAIPPDLRGRYTVMYGLKYPNRSSSLRNMDSDFGICFPSLAP